MVGWSVFHSVWVWGGGIGRRVEDEWRGGERALAIAAKGGGEREGERSEVGRDRKKKKSEVLRSPSLNSLPLWKKRKKARGSRRARANQAGAASGARSLRFILSRCCRHPSCWRFGPLRHGQRLEETVDIHRVRLGRKATRKSGALRAHQASECRRRRTRARERVRYSIFRPKEFLPSDSPARHLF